MLTGGRIDRSESGLNDHGTNYLEVMQDIISNLQDTYTRKSIIADLQRINPSVLAVDLNDLFAPGHAVVAHKAGDKALALELAQESGGFRRFYAHLLALYQRPPKQTLIFEHPEDGIHPGALSLLADEFKAAPGVDRGQIVLTTHSPMLLDHFKPNQIRVVELDGLETRIGPIACEQVSALQENLLKPGELLTTDPARADGNLRWRQFDGQSNCLSLWCGCVHWLFKYRCLFSSVPVGFTSA